MPVFRFWKGMANLLASIDFRIEMSFVWSIGIRQRRKFRIAIMAIQPGPKRKRTELFVCDNCGARKRLDRGKRHWCDNCGTGASTEMRPVKENWRKRTKQAEVDDRARQATNQTQSLVQQRRALGSDLKKFVKP
jgi:ribosomal protein L37E